MTKQEHVLLCLAEECFELGEQLNKIGIRTSKILRFGRDEVQPGQGLPNGERLVAELTDLYGMLEELEEAGIINRPQVTAKREKLRTFMAYSKLCKTITD